MDLRDLSPAYAARLTRALDHLDRSLDRRVSLEELARVSGFAPFHFHRVFRSAVGQTPREYGLHRRLERAAFLLEHGDRRRALTRIALDLGFSDASELSRSFRAHFGVSPSSFRKEPRRVRGPRPLPAVPAALIDNADGFSIEVSEEPAMRVAYVRVHDPYGRADAMLDALDRIQA
ncbi:MAG: helix-turn-helix domain-containing protein [Sandaracinaceae bacterium]